MMLLKFVVFSSLLHITVAFSLKMKSYVPINNRPIIGVLSQEVSPEVAEIYGGNYTSYIAASYVKFLEGAGTRVVPIWINKDRQYYKKMIYSLNGVLFPGGATYFTNLKGYAEAGAIIYDIAVKVNTGGDYFPLWGTCLGFELLTYLSAGQKEHRCDCKSTNQILPLEFTPDYSQSQLFGSAPTSVIDILSSEQVTANFHKYCVTMKNMTEFGLLKQWHVLSTNVDKDGLKFVSSVENIKYPFYGVMFHPEKNAFEWNEKQKTSHSLDAILIMQYLADFFVTEARKSIQTFESFVEEEAALIYNYKPTYTGDKMSFEEVYFFKGNEH